MIATILFIAILGVLVFVHELGHFITARRNGVKADEFGFGFPPRMLGVFKSEKTGKYEFVWNNQDIQSKNTVYSLNWIPLGGFVKIKGEDGHNSNENDSFSSKGAWPKIKILAAGVIMNFVLAWVLLSFSLMIGSPEAIDEHSDLSQSMIQISGVVSGSPAEIAGIKIGDEILKENTEANFRNVEEVQNFIGSQKGKEIGLKLKRGDRIVAVRMIPRENIPEGEGAIGVSLTQVVMHKYSFGKALWYGAEETVRITEAILLALGGMLVGIFSGKGVGADVSGPVGIAVLVGQVANLGITYIFRFAALLSINLGIINILPIPALDGGRILFILIGKLKGDFINKETEHKFHVIGFALLIGLMILVTVRDIIKFFG